MEKEGFTSEQITEHRKICEDVVKEKHNKNIVFACEDLFKFKGRGIVAIGGKLYSNINLGDSIYIFHRRHCLYFASKVIGIETGRNIVAGPRFTNLLLDENTVPKELFKR